MEPSTSRCETPPPSYEECIRSTIQTTQTIQIYFPDGRQSVVFKGSFHSRPQTPQISDQGEERVPPLVHQRSAEALCQLETPLMNSHESKFDRCIFRSARCLFAPVIFVALLALVYAFYAIFDRILQNRKYYSH